MTPRVTSKRRLALVLSSLFFVTSTVAAAGDENLSSSEHPPDFVAPPLHYSQDHSFRGVQDGGRVDGFTISGHAAGLPGVHDYLRLVPPNPLAHGAIFSEKPLTSNEWIAEIAFRVHGPTSIGEVEHEGKKKREAKGGRGLAFWFTNENNPTAITISPSPNDVTVSAPPPLTPLANNDPYDTKTSLFGFHTTFQGLGIVFDSTPNAPLLVRSSPKNAGEDIQGVAPSGVVCGIMDDGKGDFLDSEKRSFEEGDEAAYIQKSVGECEAAFRNAQGLLWARVSYISGTIRVDLDLSPHTTLAKAGRDYAHNCFHLDGIALPPKGYVGLTAMASGSAEPDAVDVYAMDVFEVVRGKDGEKGVPRSTDEPPEELEAEPLEGTGDDPVVNLAHEIFLSQAKMIEAIDALGRRVDMLSQRVQRMPRGKEGEGGDVASPHLANRLTAIDARLSEISKNVGGTPVVAPSDTADSVKHLLQLQERLMVELQAFGRKLDTSNGQVTASLATLSSRSSESLQLLQRAAQIVEEQAAKGSGWYLYLLLAASTGAVGFFVGRGRDDSPWGRGKKMI